MTDEVAQPGATVLLDSVQFDHPFCFGVDDAHVRPCLDRGRPRLASRRAVDRARRRPSSAHPGEGRRVRRRSGVARSADPGRARLARHRTSLYPSGRCGRGGPCRRGHRGRHADGVGQDALLRAASPPGDRRRSGRPGALPVPDQGPGAGPGGRVLGALEGGRPVDLGGDVRRRHPGADPIGGPEGRPGRRVEPGHAQLGDPPPPHEVVPAVRAAPGHRHRRAAHVPRRLRQPCRERDPAPASPVRSLRQHARSSSAARRRSRTPPSSRRC